ncbi:MFS transporter [Sporomusa sphaeroides]|uniref:MFS transporter n=1 Tax=Sporomusa sphaeroides TaxID=47679 RepID=UPI002BFC0BDC|nr:MFS transporter [Sporomusa sphaeroides]HML33270.1 MFS transporter [Sporomusa sphaeroides]
MTKARIWTKDFLLNALVNFLVYLVYFLLMIIIAGYAVDNLQASLSEAGLAVGLFIVGALFARFFGGKSVELVGRQKMLYIGLTVYLIATLLYFQSTNLHFLFVVRFLHGLGFGLATVATGTIVANIIPGARRGEGISYYAMSSTLASAFGPFLGIYLNQQVSFNAILGICILLVVICYIAAFLLKVPEAALTAAQLEDMKRFTLSNFVEFKALPISVIGAILGLCYSGIVGFIASYTREINLIEAGSFFFIVYSAAILISRPLTGRWFDLKGEGFVLYPSFVLFAIGLAILSLARQDFILLLAGMFIGLGFGTFLSSGQAVAIKSSPDHRMGLATSTFFAITDIGVGLGPFFLGLLVPFFGFRGLYMSMAGVALLAMGLYYLLCGKKAQSEKRFISCSH